MALHSVSAGSGAIERAKYVSFIVNPKRNLARLMDDPDKFVKDWPGTDLLLKRARPGSNENRVSSVCHNLLSLHQKLLGAVAFVNPTAKIDVVAPSRSL